MNCTVRAKRYTRIRGAAVCLACLATLLLLGGCSGDRLFLDYPREQIRFDPQEGMMPTVFAGVIRDMRPVDQREGRGFTNITYPDDSRWGRPVVDLYGDALLQDLAQTQLVEVVPLRAQADYEIEVDLLSFTSRIERSYMALALPVVLGMGAGILVGEDASHGRKLGAVLGGVAFIGLPMPVDHKSTVEARMRIRDNEGLVIWDEICVGEYEERVGMTAVDRDYQKLVDKHLVRAIKRCNACLVGQLRQQLMERLQ